MSQSPNESRSIQDQLNQNNSHSQQNQNVSGLNQNNINNNASNENNLGREENNSQKNHYQYNPGLNPFAEHNNNNAFNSNFQRPVNNFRNNNFIPPPSYFSSINNIPRRMNDQNNPINNTPNPNPNINNMNPFRFIPNQNIVQPPRIYRNGTISYDENNGLYTDQSDIYSLGSPSIYNNNINNRQMRVIPPSFPTNPHSQFIQGNNAFNPNYPVHGPHGHFPQVIPPSPYIANNRPPNNPFLSIPPIRFPRRPRNFNSGIIKDQLEDVEIKEEFIKKNKIKECVICLQEYSIGEKICYLPCFHFFHSDCIKKWIDTSSKCPICNNIIKFD